MNGRGMTSAGQTSVITRRPLAFAPAGAWRRDNSLLAIRYEPTGHVDPVLTALLMLVTESPVLQESPLVSAVFRELTSPTAAGHCATCHSIQPGTATLAAQPAMTWPDPEQTDVSRLSINWRFNDASRGRRGFTKFSHGPHLLQPHLADCTHCHKIDTTADTAASFATRQFLTTASEFLPLSKQQCVECHRPQVAGDSCLLCHNYHVDELPDVGHRMFAEGARPTEAR